MPHWFRKILVVLISIVTFGMVTPQALGFNTQQTEKLEKNNTFEEHLESNHVPKEESKVQEFDSGELFLARAMKDAADLSYQKFGKRIQPIIQEEFREIILPNIEKVLEEMIAEYPEEELSHLAITETPGGGLSERIFHVTDQKSGRDILRFHVRRDQPPQAGYWFNFHYHEHKDHFQLHHELGSIYWDKNTPPNWKN